MKPTFRQITREYSTFDAVSHVLHTYLYGNSEAIHLEELGVDEDGNKYYEISPDDGSTGLSKQMQMELRHVALSLFVGQGVVLIISDSPQS